MTGSGIVGNSWILPLQLAGQLTDITRSFLCLSASPFASRFAFVFA
jgi:hypothetical protein